MIRLIVTRSGLYSCTCLVLMLAGCGSQPVQDSAPSKPVDISNVPDVVPRVEPRSKYGNPDSYVVYGKRYYVLKSSAGYDERGIASWYGTKFHGKRTSSGETYDMYALTAAHKTLPLPTYVRVTNLENNRSLIVRVNDRGPFHENRIIDLSYAAASRLGVIAKGTALVEVRAINPGEPDVNTSDRIGAPVAEGDTNAKKGIEQFYIQVGAFSDLSNAEQLRRRLEVLGANLVKISQAVVNGQVLNRVRIGPFVDVSVADQIVMRLDELGINDRHIVTD